MADGWKYYNHALIPATAPHEAADLEAMKRPGFWKRKEGKPLFARWVTDFDCDHETNWWYVIKDTPFDAAALKSKQRNKLNKSNKNFEVVRIHPTEYVQKLYKVTVAAYSVWPEKYRPALSFDDFRIDMERWKDLRVYGAFFRESGELCGYAYLTEHDSYLDFNVLRTMPEYEKHRINMAVVHRIVDDYAQELSEGKYICDGSRNINHETTFQDYLEENFGFRKAYCKLKLQYRFPVGLLVKVIYPFKSMLKKMDGVKLIHLVNAVLKMEELTREKKSCMN